MRVSFLTKGGRAREQAVLRAAQRASVPPSKFSNHLHLLVLRVSKKTAKRGEERLVHELCRVRRIVRTFLRQNLKLFTPARVAGEQKAKGGGWGAMKAVLLSVQCVRLPARATQPSAVVRPKALQRRWRAPARCG